MAPKVRWSSAGQRVNAATRVIYFQRKYRNPVAFNRLQKPSSTMAPCSIFAAELKRSRRCPSEMEKFQRPISSNRKQMKREALLQEQAFRSLVKKLLKPLEARAKIGLSQQAFALFPGGLLARCKTGQQGRRSPTGAAKTLPRSSRHTLEVLRELRTWAPKPTRGAQTAEKLQHNKMEQF